MTEQSNGGQDRRRIAWVVLVILIAMVLVVLAVLASVWDPV
jgi:hypothetical protein